MLGEATGPVCPSARSGGGGAAGSGSRGILKGEQWGDRWAVAPDLRGRTGARGTRFLPSGFGFLYLILLKAGQDWAEMWGKRTLLISLSPEDTGEARSESAVWLGLLRCGPRSGRRQNYSSLPPPPFCSGYTHTAHSSGMWRERSSGARSRPGQEVTRPRAVAREHPRFQKSPQRSLRQTSLWIPLHTLFLVNVPEN